MDRPAVEFCERYRRASEWWPYIFADEDRKAFSLYFAGSADTDVYKSYHQWKVNQTA